MGTYTAQILVGHSHLYHGGIKPSHVLFLSENGRTAWCLYPILVSQRSFEKICLCDPAFLMEDAMLILGLFVLKNKKLLHNISNPEKLFADKYIVIWDVFSKEDKNTLYKILQDISWNGFKICISIFEWSSLRNISILRKYKGLEFEVCVNFYGRFFNPWHKIYYDIDKTSEKEKTYYLKYLDFIKGQRKVK